MAHHETGRSNRAANGQEVPKTDAKASQAIAVVTVEVQPNRHGEAHSGWLCAVLVSHMLRLRLVFER
jgi:hypothetical protein